MPADPLQDAAVGETSPLVTKLDTVNGVLEAARDFRRRRLGNTGGEVATDPKPPACYCWIRNDTGGDLDPFSVVVPGTPVISAVDAPHSVNRTPVYPGTVPAATTDLFAVLTEPVADGSIGLAVIMGQAVCDIDVTDVTHGYATPKTSDSAKLASAAAGPARIIWKATGTGTKRAVVLIGDGAASPLLFDAWQYTGPAASWNPTVNGSFVDTGYHAISLPSAGLYLLNYSVSSFATSTASTAGASRTDSVYTQLYDVTNSLALAQNAMWGAQSWTPATSNAIDARYAAPSSSFYYFALGPVDIRINGRWVSSGGGTGDYGQVGIDLGYLSYLRIPG